MKEFFKVLITKPKDQYYITLSKYLDNHTKKFIVTANPETFTLAESDLEVESILLNKENDIVPDGISIVRGAGLYGIKISERITGIDTTLKLLELLNNKKKTLYLFGATEEVLEKLTAVIKENYPCIKILGSTNGYVEDKNRVFKNIIDLNPDVCLVALGIPAQEKLIAKHIGKARKGIYMGVGGTFDVLSGSKKRAPKIFIKMNLEWLYRITREPKRLKRFYKNNIKFIWKCLLEKK